jgi:16S rRNA (uracil1498-N3)-methyltransferase
LIEIGTLMANRYFVETPVISDRAVLTAAEAHHLAHVMRAKTGDEVLVFDGSGAEFTARIDRVGRSEIDLAIVARLEMNRESPLALTLGVALPKGDRQRWLVEKVVELGIARLAPLETARGVAQPVDKAIERLRRGVIEASKQCGRNRLMEITESQDWATFLQAAPSEAVRLVAHPGGESLSTMARPAVESDTREIWMAIGPEGGFSDQEIHQAMSAGWRVVNLGPRILRIETAAAYLAAWCQLG